jgi:BTB/POZ domain
MLESRAKEIVLEDVRKPIFLALLEYLYTDEVEIPLDIAMELFQVSDSLNLLLLHCVAY